MRAGAVVELDHRRRAGAAAEHAQRRVIAAVRQQRQPQRRRRADLDLRLLTEAAAETSGAAGVRAQLLPPDDQRRRRSRTPRCCRRRRWSETPWSAGRRGAAQAPMPPVANRTWLKRSPLRSRPLNSARIDGAPPLSAMMRSGTTSASAGRSRPASRCPVSCRALTGAGKRGLRIDAFRRRHRDGAIGAFVARRERIERAFHRIDRVGVGVVEARS